MPGDPTTSLKDRSHAHLLLIVFPSEKFAADKIAAQHPEKWKRKFFFHTMQLLTETKLAR